eukprot:scaffold322070_cov18-Tisochrysis_lutea.AAC.1
MKEGKRLRKPNGRVHQGRKFSLTSQLARASPKAGWSALRAVGAAAGGHRSFTWLLLPAGCAIGEAPPAAAAAAVAVAAAGSPPQLAAAKGPGGC